MEILLLVAKTEILDFIKIQEKMLKIYSKDGEKLFNILNVLKMEDGY